MRSYLIFTLILISTTLNAQKLEVDTFYYNQDGKRLYPGQPYEKYAVVKRDRQRRIEGYFSLFDKSGVLQEVTDYHKGAKNGIHYKFNQQGFAEQVGFYEDDKPTGIWVKYFGKDRFAQILNFKNGIEVPYNIEFEEEVKNPYEPLAQGKNPFAFDSTMIDTPASFYGGVGGWVVYLQKNLAYPKEAAKYRLQGDVLVEFTILKTGELVAPFVLYSPNEYFTREALRVLSKSPKWQPAMQNNRKVHSKFRERIRFSLR